MIYLQNFAKISLSLAPELARLLSFSLEHSFLLDFKILIGIFILKSIFIPMFNLSDNVKIDDTFSTVVPYSLAPFSDNGSQPSNSYTEIYILFKPFSTSKQQQKMLFLEERSFFFYIVYINNNPRRKSNTFLIFFIRINSLGILSFLFQP